MANTAEKFGLRPYRSLNGASWNNAQNRYTISDNNSTAIYQGDLVIAEADGEISRHVAGNSAAIVGVFNGCTYTDPVAKKPVFSNYYPGLINVSDIVAYVVDDPETVFLINADQSFARTDVFANYSVDGGTGNTKTGISEVQLDVSSADTLNYLALQAIDISQDPANSDQTSVNTNVLVRINNHFYKGGTTGLTT
jgi:hypothetical protein